MHLEELLTHIICFVSICSVQLYCSNDTLGAYGGVVPYTSANNVFGAYRYGVVQCRCQWSRRYFNSIDSPSAILSLMSENHRNNNGT